MKNNKLLHSMVAVLTIFMLLLASQSSEVLAASEGQNDASTFISVPFEGSVAGWSNSSGNEFDSTVNNNVHTQYLKATNYSFNIPEGSIITGITVVINRRALDVDKVTDYQVRIVKNGNILTDDHASPAIWPFVYGESTYGGISEKWGTNWTVADINSPDFGVAISATGLGECTARINYIRITVHYTNPVVSTTSVVCGSLSPSISFGESVTCEATVTRSSGTDTPGGNVNWSTGDGGSFTPETCILSGSAGISTCTVSYTPAAVGDGSHSITAAYAGDANFLISSGSQTVTVNKATPTLSLDNTPVTYNGLQQEAVVTGSVAGDVSGILYNGSADVPVDAGTYPVTASFSPVDTANYISLSNVSAGSFVINKLPVTVKADAKEKYVGDADPELTYTFTPALLSGDVFTGALSRAAGEVIGTYGIVQGTLTLPANYDLIFEPANLTITELPSEGIKIQIDDPNVQQKQEFTAKVIGRSTGLYGVQVFLTYDSALLEVTNLTLGGDLFADFPGLNQLEPGKVSFAYSQTTDLHPDPVSGDNILLATITFKAKESVIIGPTDVGFASSPSTKFGDLNGISLGVYPGTLEANSGSIEILEETAISGAVTLQGRTNHIGTTMELTGTVTATSTTDADGLYSFDALIAGLYDLNASYQGYLKAVLTDINLDPQSYSITDVILLGGDANHDNVIDINDLSLIAEYFLEQTTGPYLQTDINEDGETDILDLVLTGSNYQKQNTPWSWTP
ncbi:MAG: hypothetical protein EHM41_20940 [Chloroflexi bacterium]|nr:MAG: hypothetical protein EHM41_20940 [Chloroflexota bacterium]